MMLSIVQTLQGLVENKIDNKIKLIITELGLI